MTLDQYFHQIVNKPVKEHLMFNTAQEYLAILKERFTSLWTKPVAFVEEDPKLHDDGYWAFEMYTPEWVDLGGETVKEIHTLLVEPNEGTWIEVLDRILDAMEAHYGYSIKEQVYYSVNFPLNDTDDKGKPFPGYGRCLNDERLQQLLLAFPELYLSGGWNNSPEREAMFK